MAEIGANYVLSSGGGSVSFNTRFAETWEFFMTDVQGLDGLTVGDPRVTIEDAPRAPGSLVLNSVTAGRHVTMRGTMDVGPEGVARRNIMERDLSNVCEALVGADGVTLPTPGTLIWTPTGLTQHTLVVTLCDVQPTYPGQGLVKEYVFGLFAADPTISVA